MPSHRIFLCLTLAACGGMPDLQAPAAPPGPAPAIAPIDGLLAQMPPPGSLTVMDPTGLAARAAALQARAVAMRGPVADPATRERLAASLR